MADDIDLWISKLKARDARAIEVIWQEYFETLVVRARTKLGASGCREQDGEDVALSAMYSFVRGAERGRFPQLNDRNDLWRILLTITARKAGRRRRKQFAAKRGGGAVRGESVFIKASDLESSGGIGEVLGEEPSPELAVEIADNCRNLMSQLGDSALEQIVLLKLEGCTNVEIADRVGCTTRTIERKLERIREKWQDNSLT